MSKTIRTNQSHPWIHRAVHIMLDIETLDTRLDARVSEIGAAVVTIDKGVATLEETMQINVDWLQQGERSIAKDTLNFHVRTGTVNRLFNLSERIGVYRSLNYLCDMYDVYKGHYETDTPVYTWCKSTPFDIGILKHLFDDNNFTIPWSYRNVEELRTLKRVVDLQNTFSKNLSHAKIKNGAHIAENDALFQVWQLCYLLNELIDDDLIMCDKLQRLTNEYTA